MKHINLISIGSFIHSFIHSFIYSGYFYSASSSSLLLRGAADRARILCRNFTPKRHRQLLVKDLPKVPTMAAKTRGEPMTLRTKGVDSTNAPPMPHKGYSLL